MIENLNEFDAECNDLCIPKEEPTEGKVPKYSEKVLKEYKEFNNWLTDVFVEKDSPKIVELLVVKNLLKRYFSNKNNFITKELRKIPLEKMQEIFLIKSKYKIPKASARMESTTIKSQWSLQLNNLEEKMMEEKYLKPLENPAMAEIIKKMGCLAGFLLRIIMQRKDLTGGELDVNKEMTSQKNLDGFCGFKYQFLQTVMRYCMRQFKSSEGKTIKFDDKKKNTVLQSIKKLGFEHRIQIGGKTVKNMIVYLSSNGRICKDSTPQMDKLFGKKSKPNAESLEESSSISKFDQLLDFKTNNDKSSKFGSNNGSVCFNGTQGGFMGSLMGDLNCGKSLGGGSLGRSSEFFL